MTRFAKLVLSGLTALSLSLAPVPASAGPDGEDIAKALAGLAVLGLIAHSANDRKKKRRAAAAQTVTNPYGSIEHGLPSGRVIEGEIRRPGQPGQKGNYWQDRARDVALPDQCLLVVRTDRGDRTAYGKRCLQRNYRHYTKLPNDCRLQVRTDRGVRQVYGARCLRRDGWQVARY
jgi:hypothetical protein